MVGGIIIATTFLVVISFILCVLIYMILECFRENDYLNMSFFILMLIAITGFGAGLFLISLGI